MKTCKRCNLTIYQNEVHGSDDCIGALKDKIASFQAEITILNERIVELKHDVRTLLCEVGK